MATPTQIAAYLALFTSVGFLFLFANLVIGWLLRPSDPHAEKREIYECGEPTIGSSFVQFDLRFYVVALVFIVFDAEVAFLFPAATVFGKQTQLADTSMALVETAGDGSRALTPAAAGLFRELGVNPPPATADAATLRQDVKRFTWYIYAATLLFFLVLFVGFAYEWKTGAYDWVRAITRPRSSPASPGGQSLDTATGSAQRQPVLSS